MQLAIMTSLFLRNFHHVHRITDPGGAFRSCALTIDYLRVEDISTTGVQHPSHGLSNLPETATLLTLDIIISRSRFEP